MTPAERRAYLVAASDRALMVLEAGSGSISRQQLAKDIVWLLIEVRRLEELVEMSGLSITYGTHD